MEYDEAFGLLDELVQARYGADAFDFLSAYNDGIAPVLFPDSEDLYELAEALDTDEVEIESLEDYV